MRAKRKILQEQSCYSFIRIHTTFPINSFFSNSAASCESEHVPKARANILSRFLSPIYSTTNVWMKTREVSCQMRHFDTLCDPGSRDILVSTDTSEICTSCRTCAYQTRWMHPILHSAFVVSRVSLDCHTFMVHCLCIQYNAPTTERNYASPSILTMPRFPLRSLDASLTWESFNYHLSICHEVFDAKRIAARKLQSRE